MTEEVCNNTTQPIISSVEDLDDTLIVKAPEFFLVDLFK